MFSTVTAYLFDNIDVSKVLILANPMINNIPVKYVLRLNFENIESGHRTSYTSLLVCSKT